MEVSLQSPQEIKDFILATIREESDKKGSFGLSGIDKELLERMVRVEEELKHIHQRFEVMEKNMDKRFEIMEKNMDKRFDVVDKRFDRQDRNMKWFIGLSFTLIMLPMSFYKFMV